MTINLKSWFSSWTLTRVISVSVGLVILAAGGGAGYIALDLLTEHKVRDALAIQYLQLERLGREWTNNLALLNAKGETDAETVFRRAGKGEFHRVRGAGPDLLTYGDLGLESPASLRLAKSASIRFQVFEYGGRLFLYHPKGGLLSQIDPTRVFSLPNGPKDSSLYLATKEGKLAFSSDLRISPATFTNRTLVQEFAANDLGHGQISFDGNDGISYFGFFQDLPGTNLVLFAELPKDLVLAGVDRLRSRFAAILGILLVFALLLLQYPLFEVTQAVRELLQAAAAIADGQFRVTVRKRGFGEIRLLTRAFAAMGEQLAVRDEAIGRLIQEQKEKGRLEGELALTRSVQENFLPQDDTLRKGPLEIACRYEPAAEAAGDWYNFYYDEKSGETVVIIADVSGHGAGSAMFTAVIGGLFEDFREQHLGQFPMEDFTHRLNRVMRRLGRCKWHATLLLMRHVKGWKELAILSAGHCQPQVMTEDEQKPVRSVPVRGVPVGLDEQAPYEVKMIPWEKGSMLVAYTDGLIGVRNTEGRSYGIKRLRKVIAAAHEARPATIIESILNDLNTHRGQQAAEDDLCVIGIRAV